MSLNLSQSLKPLVAKCLTFAPYKMAVAFLLMLFSSITSGIGILLIVPLIALLGIELGASSASGVSLWLSNAFKYLNFSPSLASILLVYVALIVLVATAGFFNSVISTSLQQSFVVHLRLQMARALFYTQWRFLSQTHMPDFIRLLTGQVQAVASCLTLFLGLARSLILVLVYLAFSLLLSVKLTLFALFCGLLLVVILWPLNQRIHASGGIGLTSNRALYRALFENIASLKMIKSFAAEERHIEHLQVSSKALEVQQVRLAKFNALTRLVNLVGAAIIFSVLFYSAIRWLKVPVENLLLILFIFSRLMPQIASIQGGLQSLIHKAPSYQDLLQRMAELAQWAEPQQGLISSIKLNDKMVLSGISYNYIDSARPALQNVTATILPNQTMAIVGASGAGKSTLADIISGLVAPSIGDIMIDGIRLDDDNRQAWRQQVAYVTQDVFLFHDTVRANLSWVCDPGQFDGGVVPEQELWRALELAAATEFVQRLPNGLDTTIGDRGVKLSGGERQRLALARALLQKPRMLILDEATSALDRDNELKIRDALMNLDGKLTIIIIAHNETTIEHVAQRLALTPLGTNTK